MLPPGVSLGYQLSVTSDQWRPAQKTCQVYQSRSGQRLPQILDQIVDVLDADGQAHERGVNLERRSGDRGVRHRRGQFDEALDAAQRLGQREESRTLDR